MANGGAYDVGIHVPSVSDRVYDQLSLSDARQVGKGLAKTLQGHLLNAALCDAKPDRRLVVREQRTPLRHPHVYPCPRGISSCIDALAGVAAVCRDPKQSEAVVDEMVLAMASKRSNYQSNAYSML